MPAQRLAILAAVFLLIPTSANATRIAVASNFAAAAQAIASRLEARSDYDITLVFGSTGKHYAQIKNGAPFHAFLAADAAHPRRLESEGAVAGRPFTYALGKIVLWSSHEGLVDAEGTCLRGEAFEHVAIANPRLAPYGKAARQVLTALGLWNRLEGRIVLGQNIGQTFHFVRSGNAELGFVAYAQIRFLERTDRARADRTNLGSLWNIPQSLYTPIEQQAVLLADDPGARAFLEFLNGKEGRETVESFGYATP